MNESKHNILEKLAALEHEQWSHWTQHFLRGKHTPEDLHRWIKQMNTPYEQLPEETKEKDREWARRVLEITENEQ